MIFKQKNKTQRDASRLTQRMWDFTGTAMLNLFMFLFLIAYLAPLSVMLISSFTPSQQFLDANAP
ncbi:MAG: hypothetical protein M3Y68_15375, partial [Chloroflexota bacterium]|nr:hypothetical protein [Chloroflexota bacterium]